MVKVQQTKWCPACERRKDASLFVKVKKVDRCLSCVEKRKEVERKRKQQESGNV